MEYIIDFISESGVGMIPIPGNCTGYVSYKNRIASSFHVWCKVKALSNCYKEVIKDIRNFVNPLTLHNL
jgi:hypothetical protein